MEIGIEKISKYEPWSNGLVISVIGRTYYRQRSYYTFLGKIYKLISKQVKNE